MSIASAAQLRAVGAVATAAARVRERRRHPRSGKGRTPRSVGFGFVGADAAVFSDRRGDRHRRGVSRSGDRSTVVNAYVDGAPPSINAESFDESSIGVTEFVAETKLPTDRGFFRVRGYRHSVDGGAPSEPVAIISGDIEGKEKVPVRVHDACFTSEVLGSLKCDCKQQLQLAMEYVQENDGMVIYLHQEGRGIGLANKIAAYALQDIDGLDTVDANRALGLPDDVREYTAVANILEDLGIKSIQLMTNNPRKVATMQRLGIAIDGRIPCIVKANLFNVGYLEAKEGRMKHYLDGSWCYWDHDGTVDEGDEATPPGAEKQREGVDVVEEK